MSKYIFTKEESLASIKFYYEETYILNEVAKIFIRHYVQSSYLPNNF